MTITRVNWCRTETLESCFVAFALYLPNIAAEVSFSDGRFVPGTSVGEASWGDDGPEDWDESFSLNVGCSSGVKDIFTRNSILKILNFSLSYQIIKNINKFIQISF